MASYETNEEKLVRERFEALWNAETPVQYPNEGETTPSDRTEWVRLTVLPSDGGLADVAPSNARHRYDGQVVVQVFVPRGKGTSRSNRLCQRAIDAFNYHSESAHITDDKDLFASDNTPLQFHDDTQWEVTEGTDTSLVFRAAFKRTIGDDGEGWYQQNVIAPYHRDSLVRLN